MTEKYFRQEDLEGKAVYDTRGTLMGAVKDVAYSTSGRPAIVITKEGKEQTIPFQDISGIGDIVVVIRRGEAPPPFKEAGAPPIQAPPSVPTSTCPKCGAEMKPGAKFCGRCGVTLA